MSGMTFDRTKREYVDMPPEMKMFFDEIEAVCQKYGFSIAHEDGFGGFVIEDYQEKNIEWLRAAAKNYPRDKRNNPEYPPGHCFAAKLCEKCGEYYEPDCEFEHICQTQNSYPIKAKGDLGNKEQAYDKELLQE